MSAVRKTIDKHDYARLLSRLLPQPIRTDEELDRMTAELLRLDELEELGKASPAERKLAELLTVLIEQYEDKHVRRRSRGVSSRMRLSQLDSFASNSIW
jgi:hypothetical protein